MLGVKHSLSAHTPKSISVIAGIQASIGMALEPHLPKIEQHKHIIIASHVRAF